MDQPLALSYVRIILTQEDACHSDTADCTSSFAHVTFAGFASDDTDNNVVLMLY